MIITEPHGFRTAPRGTVSAVPGRDDALTILAQEVTAVGLEHGLGAIGIAPAARFERARHALEERKVAGLHGGMSFTYRNPARSTDPSRTVAGARSIVVGARNYAFAAPETGRVGPTARVARYAWVDYYGPLREALTAVAHHLRAAGFRAVVAADDNALVDREAAWLAGLGWCGPNANLLRPGRGAWFVLGGVITDAPLPVAAEPVADGCGRCRRCIDGCPTGAIVAPGVVDARRCLAWLLQAPGAFPVAFRVALADRIYGCDDCQEVCPPNHGRDGAPAVAGSVAAVDLLELLRLDDAELLARYGRWYLWERDPNQIRRNALVALGNSGRGDDNGVIEVLSRFLTHESGLLRAHAAWAATQLGRADLLVALEADDDPYVRAELDGIGAE